MRNYLGVAQVLAETIVKRQPNVLVVTGDLANNPSILLMHHHPLPVPFQGADLLLHTRRADLLMQFLAEHQIDLVLHGHKHRATWSHLRLGSSNAQPFFIEVVGAGAAMKSSDYDPRGHNFNLIDVAPNGTRNIRQFFMPAGGKYFEEVPASQAERGRRNNCGASRDQTDRNSSRSNRPSALLGPDRPHP